MIADTIHSAARAQIIVAAARLGVADSLAAGPRSAEEVARHCGACGPMHRLLRALVAIGVAIEEADGRFALTEAGQTLRRDVGDPALDLAIEYGDVIAPAMAQLDRAIRDGGVPFELAFGEPIWDWRARHPAGPAFHARAAATTTLIAERLAAAYDFSGISHVVDVGGGHGAMLAKLLSIYPHLSGTVFDRSPDGAPARLEAAGVAARARVVEGSFFDRVPEGGDLYLLKAIIHDWDDAESLRILRNCAVAMRPGARLLLVERTMPERAKRDAPTILSDILMLTLEHGRERTEAELLGLLAAAGLADARRLARDLGYAPLIEAVKPG
jgi:SAM-dependent methyltransferase